MSVNIVNIFSFLLSYMNQIFVNQKFLLVFIEKSMSWFFILKFVTSNKKYNSIKQRFATIFHLVCSN
jgi:hypothetical protein